MSGNAATVVSARQSESLGWMARLLPWNWSKETPQGEEGEEVSPQPTIGLPPGSFIDPTIGSGEEAVQTPVIREVSPEKGSGSVQVAPKPSNGESASTPLPVPSPRRKPARPVPGDLPTTLFEVLKHAKPLTGGDFDTGDLLHAMFANHRLLNDVCRQLAHPYADEEREKKPVAVAGLGAYGALLASGVAPLLPGFVELGVEHPVSVLPIERHGNAGWHFASDERVAEELKGKHLLLVVPALTPSVCKDVEACLRLIENTRERDGLGTNVTVLGVATPFIFNCKPELRRSTAGKPLVVTSLLEVRISLGE